MRYLHLKLIVISSLKGLLICFREQNQNGTDIIISLEVKLNIKIIYLSLENSTKFLKMYIYINF
jgi:hypothetical protein